MFIFSIERRQTPSRYRGESVELIDKEEADSFSVEGREAIFSIERGGRLFLYRKESVFIFSIEDIFSIERRQTPSL